MNPSVKVKAGAHGAGSNGRIIVRAGRGRDHNAAAVTFSLMVSGQAQ